MLLLCALIVGSSNVWAVDVTINFGTTTGYWAAHTNDSYTDSDSRAWSRTCSVSNMSGQAAYSQFGNSSNACGSLELTATAGKNMTVTAFSVTMSGASGGSSPTTGTIYLYKVSGETETELATASVSGTTSVTCSITSSQAFSSADKLKVSYVGTKKAIRISQLSYSYTAGGGAIDPSVAISSTSVAVGSTANISFPADLTTISFESNNTSVANVTDAGIVSGIAEGSAKITATWTAIDGKYNAGSKDFTVTVIEPTIYNKVERVSQLVAGNEYILVATDNDVAMGAVNGSNNKIRDCVAVTVSTDQVSITDEAVAVLTLGGSTGEWTFNASDNGKYLALTSSSNEVHFGDDATAATAKWTITEDFELKNNSQSRYLRYNSGSPRFACYTSGQQTAVLFVKAGSAEVVPITISSATWATFSSTQEVEIPTGVTAYYAQKKDASTVTLKEITGGYIPANTGVVVAGAEGTYTANVTSTGATLGGTNLLKPWTTADVPTDGTYYTLAVDGSNNPVFKLSTGGTLAAGKAYLVMPAGARELSVDFGGQTTGIDEVRGQKEDVRGEYFNLAGQRVAKPTRGLYIVNGKKVVVK